MSILNRLPDDWQYQPSPGSDTAAVLKVRAFQKFEALASAGRTAREAAALLQSAPDEVVAKYSQRFLHAGEVQANDWLLAQSAPGPSVVK